MGLKLITDDKPVKVIKKERSWSGGIFNVYSLMVSSKGKDGNWTNGFVDAQFKKADESKVTNKCKIMIKNAFPTVNESNGKTYTKWMITDFDVVEEGEKPVSGDEFVNVDPNAVDEFMAIEGMDDLVPFS